MGKVRREMNTLRKNQKEMLEIKNTIIEVKPSVDSEIDYLRKDQWAWRYVNRNVTNWNAKNRRMGKKKSECPGKMSLDNLEEMDKFIKTTQQYLVKMRSSEQAN